MAFYYINTMNKTKQQLPRNEEKFEEIIDGFSSEEEICHEEILLDEKKKTQPEHCHKEEVKFKIPPPQEIQKKSYSLNPDIATGWAPKSDLPVPIPMMFDSRRIDSIVKRLADKNNENLRLCFLGPRFENTFYAWHNQTFAFPYAHIKPPQNMKITNRAFFGQNKQEQQGLIFDSFFESANLDCAIRVGERQYDLYMRVDSNTRGHLLWFNFKIKNLEKLQKYRFNICNFQKNKSLYSRGQKPFIFSQRKFERQNKGWEQAGTSIKYEQKSGKSARVLANDFNTYYKLSFDYYTEYEDDEVQMAYCIPYTYSQLTNYLQKLEKKYGEEEFLSVNKLTTSLGGLEVPLVIIHENTKKEKNIKEMFSEDEEFKVPKKCIVISGRAHPGESCGSYMMEGFLNFLCSNSKQAKRLRTDFIFKIVPMLNPDGVCLGNYRTGISGRDFNREYRNPDKLIFPEVHSFKKLVIENKAIYRENLIMFLDFHGHSVKKNVFMYGPEFPIIQRHYYECRVFPKLLGNQTPMFRYYSCSFKISEFKVTTARAVFLKKIMIPLSYTIEASTGSYYDHENLKDIPFNAEKWIEMGVKIGSTLAEYGQILISCQRVRLEKLRQKKIKKEIKIRKTMKGKTNSFSENSQPTSANQIQLLSGVQSKRINKIFEEIKKAEEQKQFSRIQDDEISEGSSDGEDEKDDLSPQKRNFLEQIIKNKRSKIPEKYKQRFAEDEVNKLSKTSECEVLAKQKEFQIESQLIYQPQRQMVAQNEQVGDDKEELLKQNINARGYLLRNRNHPASLVEQKKQKVAARIINFSFIGHQRPSLSVEKRKPAGKSEVGESKVYDRVQQILDKKYNSKSNTNNNNGRVLDLSDNFLRSTYGSKTASRETDRRNVSFSSSTPRKIIARIDEMKYRKFLIEEYKI